MGDPSRPRGCFPPLHISRAAESGAIKEEPNLWDSSEDWLVDKDEFQRLEKRNPCLFIYFKCTGEGKGQ